MIASQSISIPLSNVTTYLYTGINPETVITVDLTNVSTNTHVSSINLDFSLSINGVATSINSGSVAVILNQYANLIGEASTISIDGIVATSDISISILLSGINSTIETNTTYETVADFRGYPTYMVDDFVTKMNHIGVVIIDVEEEMV